MMRLVQHLACCLVILGAWRMISSPRKLCTGGVNLECDSAHFHTRGVKFQQSVVKQNPTKKDGQMHLQKQQAEELMKYNYVDGLSITLGSP